MMNREVPNQRALFGIDDAADRYAPVHCTIRAARRHDLPELRVLAQRAAHALCAVDYTAQQIATVLRYGMAVDEQLVADRTCYVIDSDDGIIAVGAWSFRAAARFGEGYLDHDGNADDVLDPRAHAAGLRGFFCHPGYARRGLGMALAVTCEQSAAMAGFTRLEAMTTPTGRRLFLACGFRDVEPVTHVFPNAIAAPAYRMRKTIAPAAWPSAVWDCPSVN